MAEGPAYRSPFKALKQAIFPPHIASPPVAQTHLDNDWFYLTQSGALNRSIILPEVVIAEDKAKLDAFIEVLTQETVDLDRLREMSRGGIPRKARSLAWQLLFGYLPASSSERPLHLKLKRDDYVRLVRRYSEEDLSEPEQETLKQIKVDVPRTHPNGFGPLFQHPFLQDALQRVLLIWSLEHEEINYFQGLNDLPVPFLLVFLSSYFGGDPQQIDLSCLTPEILVAIEADAFWCASNLLAAIAVEIAPTGPSSSLYRNLARIRELVAMADPELDAHLRRNDVDYMHFSFRWVICLLSRELGLASIVRLWDTYLSVSTPSTEGDREQKIIDGLRTGFAAFHNYVCAAFLLAFRENIMDRDFSEALLLLQRPPTQEWDSWELEWLLDRAWKLAAEEEKYIERGSATVAVVMSSVAMALLAMTETGDSSKGAQAARAPLSKESLEAMAAQLIRRAL